MRKQLGRRFALIGVAVLLAAFYIYPTIKWAGLEKDERKALMEEYKLYDAEHAEPELSEEINTYLYRWYKGDKSKAVNLGLDLQGGMQVLLRVDAAAAMTNEMVRTKDNLRRRFVDGRVIVGTMTVEDGKIVIPVTDSARSDAERVVKEYSDQLVIQSTADTLMVSMNQAQIDRLRDMSVKQALETIRKTGTALLIVEQHVQHALDLCDEVALLDHGAIAWEGPASEAAEVVVTHMFDREDS